METARLVLCRPLRSDAAVIFERYASDPEVTRYLGWPRHRSVADTDTFLTFSDQEWQRWLAGPYLIRRRDDGQLLGGTGLGFETAEQAVTGYVLAQDAWGKGYATEALAAMVQLARKIGVMRLYALCHPDTVRRGGFSRNAASCPTPADRGRSSFQISHQACCSMPRVTKGGSPIRQV